MNTFVRLLVTAGIIFLFFLCFGLLIEIRKSMGLHTPGLIGIIFFLAAFYAIKTIWKNKRNSNNRKDRDYPTLQE